MFYWKLWGNGDIGYDSLRVDVEGDVSRKVTYDYLNTIVDVYGEIPCGLHTSSIV